MQVFGVAGVAKIPDAVVDDAGDRVARPDMGK